MRKFVAGLLGLAMLISAFPIISFAENEKAEIVFGSKVKQYKMSSTTKGDIVVRGGIEGIVLDPDGSSVNLNLDLDSSFSDGNINGNCVEVKVSYYDEGEGKFTLNYDGRDKVEAHPDIVRLTNSEMWKTKTYIIENPRFSNSINGWYDLQLSLNTSYMGKSESKVIVSKVEVLKLDYKSVYNANFDSKNPGNIFDSLEDIEINLHAEIIKRMKVEAYLCDIELSVRDENNNVCWTDEIKDADVRFGYSATIKPEGLKFGLYHLDATLKNEKHNYKSTYSTYFSYSVKSRINKNLGIGTHYHHSYPDPDKALYLAEKAGFGIIRDGIYWSSYEKAKGVYSTSGTKNMPEFYEEMAKSNMDYLQIAVAGNTLYMETASQIPQTDEAISAYAAYCASIVKEVKPEAIEIWNEPNTSRFGGITDWSFYTKTLKAAYTAVKAVDPEIEVVGCCLMSSPAIPLDIVGKILDCGGGDYMDAISIHPYMWMGSPANDMYESKIALLKDFLIERGYGNIDIWITELGYGGGPAINFSEDEQALFLTQAYIMSESFESVKKYFWYDFQNDELIEYDREGNFGMVRHWDDNEPWAAKKLFIVAATMNKMLAEAVFVKKLSGGEHDYVYRFARDNEDIYAVFSDKSSHTIGLKTDKESVTVTDVCGNESVVYAHNGVINILAHEGATYISGEGLNFEICEPTVNVSSNDLAFVYGEGYELKTNFGKLECVSYCENLTVTQVTDAKMALDFKEYQTKQEKLIVKVMDSDRLLLSGEVNVKCLDRVSVSIDNVPYSIDNFNRWVGTLKVTNNSKNSVANGVFEFETPDLFSKKLPGIEFSNILPGASKEIKFNFPEILRKEAYSLSGIVRLNGGYERHISNRIDFAVASYAETKPVIDGVIEDGEWAMATAMDMMYQDQAINLNNFKWTGTDDLSGRICLEYDEDNLYMAAVIKDDIHYQPHSDYFIWQGDSIQFGTAYERANGNEMSTAYTEIGMALTPDGEKLFITKPEDVTIKAGEVDMDFYGTECKIKREGNITTYELKLPRPQFSPLEAVFEGGRNIAFSMLVNDNDGLGRKGWLEYASGLGMGKNITLFTFLKLMDRQ